MSNQGQTIWRRILTRRMLVALFMGFSAGLPLLLTLTLLQAWMKDAGVDLGTIGLFGLVGLPYTFKFLWAPLVDRFSLPFLGRRRGWLIVTQLLIIAAIFNMSFGNPADNYFGIVIASLLLTFFSATQDIVIDAYRRETLEDDEQGLGAALYVNGYRFATLLVSGGGLILADMIAFEDVYRVMALLMFVGVATTLFADEPVKPEGTPTTLTDAVVRPFVEYFSRNNAILVLAFIVLYKVGDMMANHMSIPFYLDIGFSRTEVGAIVKLFGFWATISGLLVGGLVILRWGLYKSLWVFGILQALSTALFAVLASVGYHQGLLAAVISFENLSMGLGTSALLGFMATLTNRKFTATQFALLSSLAGIPRVVITAPTGFLAEAIGWQSFFIFCALIAIPGLLLLLKFRDWTDLQKQAGQ